MLLGSECIARAALEREESRGGHTRDDFPEPSEEWATKNLVLTTTPDYQVLINQQPLPVMPGELQRLFEVK